MTWAWQCCCATGPFPSLDDCTDCTQMVPTSATLTFSNVNATACGPTRCTDELPPDSEHLNACCCCRNDIYFCEACCVQVDGAHTALSTNEGYSGCDTGTLTVDFRTYVCHNDDIFLYGCSEVPGTGCPGSCCTNCPGIGENCRPDADCGGSSGVIELEFLASTAQWRVSVYDGWGTGANSFAFVGYESITAATCYDNFTVANTLQSCRCYHQLGSWCTHQAQPAQPINRMATGGSCAVTFVA